MISYYFRKVLYPGFRFKEGKIISRLRMLTKFIFEIMTRTFSHSQDRGLIADIPGPFYMLQEI